MKYKILMICMLIVFSAFVAANGAQEVPEPTDAEVSAGYMMNPDNGDNTTENTNDTDVDEGEEETNTSTGNFTNPDDEESEELPEEDGGVPTNGSIEIPVNGSIQINDRFGYDTERYLGEILEAFENQTEVRVIVELKDNSGITVRGTKEERRFLLRQRDRWFEPVIDEVLANLSEEEFELNRKSLSGFSGKITKEGFDKLVNDTRVKAIYLNKAVYTADSENENFPILQEELEIKNISSPKNLSAREKEVEKEIIKTKKTSWFSKLVNFLKLVFN